MKISTDYAQKPPQSLASTDDGSQCMQPCPASSACLNLSIKNIDFVMKSLHTHMYYIHKQNTYIHAQILFIIGALTLPQYTSSFSLKRAHQINNKVECNKLVQELSRQDPLVDEVESKVDSANASMKTTNSRLKETVNAVWLKEFSQ